MNLVEVDKVIDCFGYPVVVYNYKNHDLNRDEIVKDARENYTIDQIKDGLLNHRRTNNLTEPFLQSENKSVKDLYNAYMEALNHFYSHELDYQFVDESDGPQINQSWVMDYVPQEYKTGRHRGLKYHTHYLSFVCGCYYPLFEQETGGELCFLNPSSTIDRHLFSTQKIIGDEQSLDSDFMKEFEMRCYKVIKNHRKIVEFKEGQIVLWYGNLNHGTKPSLKPSTRMSIVVNTSPKILSEKRGSYLYKIEPYFPDK